MDGVFPTDWQPGNTGFLIEPFSGVVISFCDDTGVPASSAARELSVSTRLSLFLVRELDLPG